MSAGLAPPASARRRRTLLRGLLLGAAFVLACPIRPESWFGTSVILPSLSPFVAVGGAAAARSLTVLSALAVPILLLAWLVPRVLCRYGCPVGLLQESVARLRRAPRRPWFRVPRLGHWLAAATLAGAALGYPLFLWLDPFALFNSALNAWRLPLTGASLLAGLGLPALLLLEFAAPQLWCRRLCPLGASQDLLSQGRRALARLTSRAATPARGPAAGRVSCDRRVFLAACAGGVGAIALQAAPRPPPPLRPPGAIDEERFTGVCVRCGNCAQSCPSQIIQPDLRGGLTGLLAPRLSFSAEYCRENCHRCQQVCPSGAIARLTLAEKRRAIIGRAVLDADTCLMALGRECNACVQHCPFDAVAVTTGPDGFSSRPVVDLVRCNGCGACEAVCPVRPRRAIHVAATPGRGETSPG